MPFRLLEVSVRWQGSVPLHKRHVLRNVFSVVQYLCSHVINSLEPKFLFRWELSLLCLQNENTFTILMKQLKNFANANSDSKSKIRIAAKHHRLSSPKRKQHQQVCSIYGNVVSAGAISGILAGRVMPLSAILPARTATTTSGVDARSRSVAIIICIQ